MALEFPGAVPRCALTIAVNKVAKSNAVAHQVADRIEFLESDLMSAVPSDRHFDFVVSNPPYVSQAEYESLPAVVKNQEPRTALVGGERGTEVIERLIPQAASCLRTGGWLLLEVSPMARECRDSEREWKKSIL